MRIIIVILFLFFAGRAFAQNSLLWEISGNGLQNKSYLYGTVHIQDRRVFQFGDSLMPRFNSCDAFAGELLLMKQSDPTELMKMVFMPGDTTLRMLLSKADYKLVHDYTQKKLGAMAGMVDKLKPIFTSSIITETSVNKDEPFSLDEYFQKIAIEKKMQVIGIETAQEQMSALDRVSLKEQAQMLADGIKEEKATTDTTAMEKLISIYLTQNLDSIQYYVGDADLSDAFSKSIITERNHKMAERIDTLVKNKSAFIGIGAAHLPGPEGGIALLKQRGFTLRPVYSPFNKNNEVKMPATSGHWAEFAPTGESFSVLMPSAPQLRQDSNGTSVVNSAMCIDSSGYQIYMLSYFSIPEEITQKQEESYYDELLRKLTRNKKSKLVYRKTIEENGVKGIEAEVKVFLGQVMRLRIFLNGIKAVQLTVAGSKASVKSGNADKFLNSLRFINSN